jgi:hypothetical protein
MKQKVLFFLMLNLSSLIKVSIFLLSTLFLLLLPLEFNLTLVLINLFSSSIVVTYLNKDINELAKMLNAH